MYRPLRAHTLVSLPPPIDLLKTPHTKKILEAYKEALKNVAELNGALKEIGNPNLFLST